MESRNWYSLRMSQGRSKKVPEWRVGRGEERVYNLGK
jgi:hypothetical protein